MILKAYGILITSIKREFFKFSRENKIIPGPLKIIVRSFCEVDKMWQYKWPLKGYLPIFKVVSGTVEKYFPAEKCVQLKFE